MKKCYICSKKTCFLIGKNISLREVYYTQYGALIRSSDLEKCLLKKLKIDNDFINLAIKVNIGFLEVKK